MNLLDKLDYLMSDQGLNRHKLSQISGVPYTTIDGLYKKGFENTKISTIRKLAHALGVSVDYLVGEQDEKEAPGITPEAMKVAKDYDELPAWGQHMVRTVIDDVREGVDSMDAEPVEYEPDIVPDTKTVPLFNQRFAAGPGEPDFGLMWEDYEIPADSRADFAIHVHGTSMEPYLHDGQIALGIRRQPGLGEVGAFTLNGEYVVKQYYYTEIGHLIYLFSANRDEEDKDIILTQERAEAANLRHIGTIITEKKVPLPKIY